MDKTERYEEAFRMLEKLNSAYTPKSDIFLRAVLGLCKLPNYQFEAVKLLFDTSRSLK